MYVHEHIVHEITLDILQIVFTSREITIYDFLSSLGSIFYSLRVPHSERTAFTFNIDHKGGHVTDFTKIFEGSKYHFSDNKMANSHWISFKFGTFVHFITIEGMPYTIFEKSYFRVFYRTELAKISFFC